MTESKEVLKSLTVKYFLDNRTNKGKKVQSFGLSVKTRVKGTKRTNYFQHGNYLYILFK